MNKIFCDRCKKEIKNHSETQTNWPVYIIRVKYDLSSYINVDFCPNCQEEFKKWLDNK